MPSSASALGLVGIPIRRAGEVRGHEQAEQRDEQHEDEHRQTDCAGSAAREPERLRHVPTATSAQRDDHEVGHDVHGDVDRRDNDRDGLHRPHVADRDGIDQLASIPG